MSASRLVQCFTAAFFLGATAAAGDTASSPRFVTEVFFPYHYTDTNEQQHGYIVDIMKEVLSEADVKSDIEFLPWTRAYKLTAKVPNTFLFSMMRTEKREPLFHWIKPVAAIPKAAFFSAATRKMPDHAALHDYKAHRVCAQEDTPPYQALLANGFEPGKNLFPLLDVAFSSMILDDTLGAVDKDWYNLFISGYCDYRVSIPVTMWARVKLADDDDVQIVQHIDIPSDHIKDDLLYLATHPDTEPDLVERVSTTFERLKTEGRLKKLCLDKMSLYAVTCDVFEPDQ